MTSKPTTRHADDGVTVVELLVGIVLMGLLTVALSGGLVVILRQSDNTSGRLNNSRSEQAVGTYLPTDLASASKVDTDPKLLPCSPTCPASANVGGSNALFLSWDNNSGDVATTKYTTVSYRYVQVGTEWQLVRVECNKIGTGGAYTCSTRAVVHGLDPPPDMSAWHPGETSPTWVIQVSLPLDPLDPGNTGTTIAADPNAKTKGAQRVIVTINGGGDSSGAGGGINQISLSAGGTTRSTILANSTTGVPNFTAARSRCGGRVVLVVDNSTSIGSTAIASVRTAVKNFIDVFTGTPVQLEIIGFSDKSFVLGSSNWNNYVDMLNTSAAATLRSTVDAGINSSGRTNYEDAFYRVFKNQDGTQSAVVPELVVFFTDGVPTVNRRQYNSGSTNSSTLIGTNLTSYPPAAETVLPTATQLSYDQESFNRANTLLIPYRNLDQPRMIGVGIGEDIDTAGWPDSSEFITPANGYKVDTTKAGTAYQRGYHVDTSNGNIIYSSPWTYWETTDQAAYTANNTTSGTNSTDGWRAVLKVTGTPYTNGARMSNREILERMIVGSDLTKVEELAPDGSNVDDANVAFDADFTKLAAILSTIAVGQCGGTLTLQTQDASGSAKNPFTYQNTAIRDSTGATTAPSTVVTTTAQSKSGTFDFDVSKGYVDVDIVLQNSSQLSLYNPGSLTCTVGANSRVPTAIPVAGSPWAGFRVRIQANESVSCIQAVTVKP